MIEIAIVGAGPAGAYCAFSLSKEGFRPVLFDHSHPREKPCGGGLSPFAQDEFPFLKNLPFVHEETNYLQMVYTHNRSINVVLKRKLVMASRQKLDSYILNMAISHGTQLVREKVADVERCRAFWKVKTNKGLYKTKMLIGADGIHSTVRRAVIGPFQPSDMGMCYGYIAKPLKEQHVMFKFLPEGKGYIWVFPRGDDLCAGIGGDMNRLLDLKIELDRFLKVNCPKLEPKSHWAALIPNLQSHTLRRRISGTDWVLIGDAAGHVDQITGEGIPYALRSAELACEAVMQNNLQLYDTSWRQEYGAFLSFSGKVKNLIFNRWICTPYFALGFLASGRLVA